LEVGAIGLSGITWVDLPLLTGEALEVQYRAHGAAVPAVWEERRVRFETPQIAVAPGQTAALYRGERVLGSGIISGTL
jgi:tRNA-specific 2-thiouridylase